MGAVSNNILTITEPSIELDPFDIPDIESGNEEGGDRNKQNINASKVVGGPSPAIRINEYDFAPNDIRNFTLTLGEFLPELRVSVEDSKGVFNLSSYPKDGDCLMLYIRSADEEIYKAIRMDFDIINVDAPPVSNASQGAPPDSESNPALKPVVYTFECRIKIPGLFTEVCKGFKDNTFFNHLEEIATELKIGFASNVEDTDDSMTRICAFDSRSKFIKDHTQSSYKSDDHFFTSYIDSYYYLNFVDINSQLQYDPNLEDTLFSLMNDMSDEKKSKESAIAETKLYLTNLERGNTGTDKFIQSYALQNNAAEVTLLHGYKRTIQYYDDTEKEYREFEVDPLTSENLPPDLFPLRGRNDEDRYKTEVKYKYMGKQSSIEGEGNAHDNFLFAQIHNFQNAQEIDKMYIEANIQKANMGLYMYQKVPVIIYETDNKRTEVAKQREEGIKNEGQPLINKQGEAGDSISDNYGAPKVNEFLTGVYVIGQIEYSYSRGLPSMKQKVRLLRREWPQAN